MKDDLRARLSQSVETAVALAEGLVSIDLVESGETRTYSERFACPEHGVSLPELEPRVFSFNSPQGACPRCTGLGAQQEIDPDLLVPDPGRSISDGALVPWAVGNSSFYESVIQAIADRYEIDPDEALARALRARAGLLPARHRRGQGLRHLPQPDGASARLHDRLRGHRRLARASLPRDRQLEPARAHRGVHVVPALPRLPAARGSSPRCSRSPSAAATSTPSRGLSVDGRARLPRRARAQPDRGADRGPDHQGDPRAAELPGQRRRRLPRARPGLGDALGRRGAAAAARDPDRLAAGRACSTSSTSPRSGSTSATTTA